MPHDLFIGGQFESGQGPAIEILDPATGETAALVAAATAGQVDEAVAAAVAAGPDWRRRAQNERSERVHSAMLARGYNGQPPTAPAAPLTARQGVTLALGLVTALILLLLSLLTTG